TNSEGRFEFTLPKIDSAPEGSSVSNTPVSGGIQADVPNRPSVLTARKPGFKVHPNGFAQNFLSEGSNNLTLSLTPESLIVGAVPLPTSEPPDSIMLQVYRRQVQDG